jgi:hypothetical protein
MGCVPITRLFDVETLPLRQAHEHHVQTVRCFVEVHHVCDYDGRNPPDGYQG